MFITTLIAKESLEQGDLSMAMASLAESGCAISSQSDIIDGRVADLSFEGDAEAAVARLRDNIDGEIDIAVQPAENREKKLLISDMDSTMITVECIDELASYAGIKDQIAQITERAMLGELDFEEALRGRVALLKDLDVSAINQCLQEKVKLMPGAQTLVKTMAKRGARTILVSGGFTSFANPVAAQIGFDSAHANILGESDGKLTGELDGPIVDASTKANLLKDIAKSEDLPLDQCLAVGDGANDIPMIALAGMGVAYHAKPKAAQTADVAIHHNDLSALLYLQGIPSGEWVVG